MTSTAKKSKSSRSSRRKKPKHGSRSMAKPKREVAVAAIKDDFSRYLRMASDAEIVITRHGKPAGVLIGFRNEDDWFEYRLEHHPDFLRRVSEARQALAAGRGVRLEELEA